MKTRCSLAFCLVLLVSSLSASEQESQDVVTGVQLFENGQFITARQFFESFVRENPRDPRGVFYLGRIAFSEKRYEQAVKWFEKTVQLADDNSDYHLWLGRAHGHQAMQANVLRQPFLAWQVKEHFEKAVALDPDNLAARADLMEYYFKAPGFLGGSREKAKEQAKEIARRDIQQGLQAWEMLGEDKETSLLTGPAGQQKNEEPPAR